MYIPKDEELYLYYNKDKDLCKESQPDLFESNIATVWSHFQYENTTRWNLQCSMIYLLERHLVGTLK